MTKESLTVTKAFLEYYAFKYDRIFGSKSDYKNIVDFFNEELDDAYGAGPAIVESINLSSNLSEEENKYLETLIREAKDTFRPIPGTDYFQRMDPSRGEPGPGNLRHIHIYRKGRHLFAMNLDGTAHDGCHHVKIDPKLHNFLKSKGFIIPPNGLIEILIPRRGTILHD